MSTTFISHRMFVAALNQDRAATVPPPPHCGEARQPALADRTGQLTLEQLAAFAERYWPDFPNMPGWGKSTR